jgi:hypothetical protein
MIFREANKEKVIIDYGVVSDAPQSSKGEKEGLPPQYTGPAQYQNPYQPQYVQQPYGMNPPPPQPMGQMQPMPGQPYANYQHPQPQPNYGVQPVYVEVYKMLLINSNRIHLFSNICLKKRGNI